MSGKVASLEKARKARKRRKKLPPALVVIVITERPDGGVDVFDLVSGRPESPTLILADRAKEFIERNTLTRKEARHAKPRRPR